MEVLTDWKATLLNALPKMSLIAEARTPLGVFQKVFPEFANPAAAVAPRLTLKTVPVAPTVILPPTVTLSKLVVVELSVSVLNSSPWLCARRRFGIEVVDECFVGLKSAGLEDFFADGLADGGGRGAVYRFDGTPVVNPDDVFGGSNLAASSPNLTSDRDSEGCLFHPITHCLLSMTFMLSIPVFWPGWKQKPWSTDPRGKFRAKR